MVLDIGAQIGEILSTQTIIFIFLIKIFLKGQYSLFAAKMGRKVLSVEPFHDNIIRIHKAVVKEGLENNIVLIQNAISNKRNEIKRLSAVANNIGGQTLLKDKNVTFTRNIDDKHLVETILLDDLIRYLPKINEIAIVKIDIEGIATILMKRVLNRFK